jgi:hypothetical protein
MKAAGTTIKSTDIALQELWNNPVRGAIDLYNIYCKFNKYNMRKTLAVRSAQAAVPLRCRFLLLSGCAVQYLAWQFDLEWLRRAVPLFLAIYPWTIVGFFGT